MEEERKDESESAPLVRSQSIRRDDAERARRNDNIECAVNHLKSTTYLFVVIILIFQILLLVNCVYQNVIPIWALFLVLWLGHGWLFVVVCSSVSYIFKSLQKFSSPKLPSNVNESRSTQQWHQANEKLIPLIQYTMYNHAYILSASLVAVTCEILIYLSILSIVPEYSFLVPIYIVVGIAFSNALLCKSSSISSAISWGLLLSTAILLHVKFIYPTAISYTIVLIPSYVMLGIWIVISTYVLLYHILKIHCYKADQLVMVALFIASLMIFSLADASLTELLMAQNGSPRSTALKIATSSLFLAGSAFFSAWIVVKVNYGVGAVLSRMGAEVPKSLVQTDEGGWAADRKYSTMLGIRFIIGDLEGLNEDDYDDELKPKNTIGCCNALKELLLYCVRGSSAQGSSPKGTNRSLDFSLIYESSDPKVKSVMITNPYDGSLPSPVTHDQST